MISNKYKEYGLKKIPDDEFLTTVGSVSFLFNAFSKILFGFLSDKKHL